MFETKKPVSPAAKSTGAAPAAKSTLSAAPAAKPAAYVSAPPAARALSEEDRARLEQLTRETAYALWEERGGEHGHDLEDWVRAERMARAKLGL